MKLESGHCIFEEFIEVDSLLECVGSFGVKDAFSLGVIFALEDGDFEEYFLVVDAFGFC